MVKPWRSRIEDNLLVEVLVRIICFLEFAAEIVQGSRYGLLRIWIIFRSLVYGMHRVDTFATKVKLRKILRISIRYCPLIILRLERWSLWSISIIITSVTLVGSISFTFAFLVLFSVSCLLLLLLLLLYLELLIQGIFLKEILALGLVLKTEDSYDLTDEAFDAE